MRSVQRRLAVRIIYMPPVQQLSGGPQLTLDPRAVQDETALQDDDDTILRQSRLASVPPRSGPEPTALVVLEGNVVRCFQVI